MFKKIKKNINLVYIVYALIILGILSKILFSDLLIGRYLDFSVTPVSYLLHNITQSSLSTWHQTTNGGIRNTFPPTLVPINIVLYMPLLFKSSSWFVARYQLFISIFFAMSFTYLLGDLLLKQYGLGSKERRLIAFLGGLFYALNNYLFCEILYGSNIMFMILAFIPLLVYAQISYYEKKERKYFFLSSVTILLVSSALQYAVLAFVLTSLLAVVYKQWKFAAWLYLTYLLTSLYWLLPLLYSSTEVKSLEMAVDYTANLTNSAPSLISAITNKEYFGNRELYTLALGSKVLEVIWVLNSFAILLVGVYGLVKKASYTQLHRRLMLAFFIIFLASILFIKGGHEPLGHTIIYLYNHFSPFSLFRSLQRYISFYLISLTIIFVLASKTLIAKSKYYFVVLVIMVIVNSMPWLTGDLGRENIKKGGFDVYIGQYQLSEDEKFFYSLQKKALDSALLAVPPGYSVLFLDSDQNVLSQGGDAGLVFGNKKFYCSECPGSVLQKPIQGLEKSLYKDPEFVKKNEVLLQLFNIRYIALRPNVKPLFSVNSVDYDPERIKSNLDNSENLAKVYDGKEVSIWSFKNFLPHFYVPKEIVIENTNKRLGSSSLVDRPLPLAIFSPEDQKKLAQLKPLNNDHPIIEFKKIKPTKYRLVAHKVSGSFPLVFSESFQSGWKLYQSDTTKSNKKIVANYTVDKDNEGDQANAEELNKFLEQGIVTNINTEKTDFVSKQFNSSIQNDNLPNGNLLETLFAKPLPEEVHLLANQYANAWIVDPAALCKEDSCTQNSDGTYDIAFIVEFWPQRLLSFGIVLSLLTIVSCFIYCFLQKRTKTDDKNLNHNSSL